MGKHSTAAIAATVNVVALRPATPALARATMPWQAARYPELRYMGSPCTDLVGGTESSKPVSSAGELSHARRRRLSRFERENSLAGLNRT